MADVCFMRKVDGSCLVFQVDCFAFISGNLSYFPLMAGFTALGIAHGFLLVKPAWLH